jgi:hypothetical protein
MVKRYAQRRCSRVFRRLALKAINRIRLWLRGRAPETPTDRAIALQRERLRKPFPDIYPDDER